MTERVKSEGESNRERLLGAAESLLEAKPGEELSLRAVCTQVGVQMPTLYHYFGSKSGLIEAVVARGFERYLSQKQAQAPSDDPLADIRTGWDQHVEWALGNPAIYALMWEAVPGRPTGAAERAWGALRLQTERAAGLGMLSMSADEAADRILAACVGAALFLISRPEPDLGVSRDLRESTLSAVSGQFGEARSHLSSNRPQKSPRELARELLTALQHTDVEALRTEEQAMLRRWLQDISAPQTGAVDPLR